MEFRILGPLEVRRDGRLIEVRGARLRALLIMLGLNVGQVIPADRLINELWGDEAPVDAVNALHSLVSRLRSAIGRDKIDSRLGGYLLAAEPDDLDAHRFERLAAAGQAALAEKDFSRAAELLGPALELWRGPALLDVADAAFAQGAIARLGELRLSATKDRIEADLALGRHASLLPELEALAAAHPLDERLRALQMRALYAADRQVTALEVYEQTKRALAEELGVDPSPELETTYLAVLRRDALVRGGTRQKRRTNLRAALTSFVGRDVEVELVERCLAEHRLVTLVGPGGSGKTRLAREVGARALQRTRDEVWLVELAAVTDPADIPRTMAAVLQPPEGILLTGVRDGEPPAFDLDHLVTVLASRRMLLILDNCEHVIEEVARLAEALLGSCGGLRLLATSRESLNIAGERLAPVPPLLVPSDATRLAEALDAPAVRLFADRAAAMVPGFTVSERNVADVVRICRRLDGMPLAIELAAAQMRVLSVEQLAERLDDRFRLLVGGSRTAFPRHQTLRAVVDWSWELLASPEQALLRRLSVFAGGATLESAEHVAGADVLPLLGVLADKSLLHVSREPAGVRYRMLETVRLYALERLDESGEKERLRRAHAAHFLALAERAEPCLRGRDQVSWLARLTAEHDNLRAALRHAIETHDAGTAVRLVAALGWYWRLTGSRGEGAEWARQALAVKAAAPAGATVLALLLGGLDLGRSPELAERARAAVSEWQARGEPGHHPYLTLAEPALALAVRERTGHFVELVSRHADDPDAWTRATALLWRGMRRLDDADQQAVADFDGALTAFRSVGDRWGMASALRALAEIVSGRGEYDRARTAYADALRLSDELGARHERPGLLYHLATIQLEDGETEAGLANLYEARDLAQDLGQPATVAGVHLLLGNHARRAGDLEQAREHLTAAAGILDGTDLELMELRALVMTSLGLLHATGGRLDEAEESHHQALGTAVGSEDVPVIGAVLVGLADLAARRGDHDRAAVLLGGAAAMAPGPGLSRADLSAITRAVADRLGQAALDRLFARGRAMDREELIAYGRSKA
ncbi:BTAD domain-containing putative transcriptional regulator [Nonomuraea sp. SYSU D8015]|uniref:BTAD domain-containing putative transcriptional regulator n=1 Tax=Nonomuraea sp. SYSU D8015 TaxID=2593644 RepID=UPI0016608187|nr:BTAD domain-containing putative transcriptional regulator [Nonomuraea sp. SYSU D8015]